MKTYDAIYRAAAEPIQFERYDYLQAVHDDVMQHIEDNGLADRETIYDDCFISDAVTGNASGSYTYSSYRAEMDLAGNTDLLIEALEEFGDDAESYKQAMISPEYADVMIRCYVLSQVIDDAITDYIMDHIPDTVKADLDGLDANDMIDYITDNDIQIA